MQLHYTDHCRIRMSERGVTESIIQATVESPDEILHGDEGEEIALRRYGSRELRVIFRQLRTDDILVITVMQHKVRRDEQDPS